MTNSEITRSTGMRVPGWAGPLPGGGYRGVTDELDATVAEAAALLAAAYGQAVEIRFNSDRESGGAWVKTPDGGNAETGIAASVVTASARSRWLRSAERYESEAASGRGVFGRGPGGELTATQIEGCREMAAWDRDLLARSPEGTLTVTAHITQRAALPELRAELESLDGWNEAGHHPDGGYHHGAAPDVAAALARCLRFVPPGTITTARERG